MLMQEQPSAISSNLGRNMNFGGGHGLGDDQQNQREMRERELTLAFMNQQLSAAAPQGQQQASMNQQSSGLPSSFLADLYASQAGRQDPSNSLMSQSSLMQSGNSGMGGAGLDNQNQLFYSDALNRMMPSSVASTGGFGRAAAASANPYNLNLSNADPSSLMLSGGLGGMNRIPTGTGGAGSSMSSGPSGLDPFTMAFLRDNMRLPSSSANNQGLGNQSLGPLLGAGGSRDWSSRSLQQQLLSNSQLASASQAPFMGAGGGYPGASSFGGLQQQQSQGMSESEDSGKFPTCLPVTLAVPEDNQKLSSHQVLLRNQIEAFRATEDDLTTHTRGRNKPIKLGQVGIRCSHCARLPVSRRQKGSTYFPASLHGLYQAAQNMNTTHMQSGLCTEMPPEYKQMFNEAMANKVSSSVAGRPYWAKTAKQLGLIDTEDGIRFIRDMTPSQIAQLKMMQQQQRGGNVGMSSGVKGIPGRLLS